MIIVILTYKQSLQAVDRYLEAHREFLKGLYAERKLLFSGPREPRTGGVLLFTDVTPEEVEGIIGKDPFHREGLADYQVVPFTATGFEPSFAKFAGR